MFFISGRKCNLINQKVTTDAAPLELPSFNPSGLDDTDAHILAYLGNRNSDWRGCGGGG